MEKIPVIRLSSLNFGRDSQALSTLDGYYVCRRIQRKRMRLLPIHFWSQNMSLRAQDFSSSVVRRSKHHHRCRQWYLQRKGGKDQSLPPSPLYSPFLKQLLLKHCHCIQRHRIIASWFVFWFPFFFFFLIRNSRRC